jgi:GNAT superfamily N-acetyltransferase
MHRGKVLNEIEIKNAIDSDTILACFTLVKELRPHLSKENYITQIERQRKKGYQILFIEAGTTIVSFMGYRIQEHLAWGKILYIDDFVTKSDSQNHGYGSKLIDHIIKIAKENNCDQVHLDSGYNRNRAHRLYLNKGFVLSSHHFSMKLHDD